MLGGGEEIEGGGNVIGEVECSFEEEAGGDGEVNEGDCGVEEDGDGGREKGCIGAGAGARYAFELHDEVAVVGGGEGEGQVVRGVF